MTVSTELFKDYITYLFSLAFDACLCQVKSLGLALGLLITAIEEIQKGCASVKEQGIQVIKYWLKRTEIIREMQSCPPTWSQLADAVAEEDTALSQHIRQTYCNRFQ